MEMIANHANILQLRIERLLLIISEYMTSLSISEFIQRIKSRVLWIINKKRIDQ